MKLLLIASTLLCSSVSFAAPNAAQVSFAEPPPAQAMAADGGQKTPAASATQVAALALVQKELVSPLVAKEGSQSKFSRARLPPRERQVRVIDRELLRDSRGRTFVRFVIDERRGLVDDAWNASTITGCAYLSRSEIFVQKGDQYRPADFLLGKYRKAAADSTCKSDPRVVRR